MRIFLSLVLLIVVVALAIMEFTGFFKPNPNPPEAIVSLSDTNSSTIKEGQITPDTKPKNIEKEENISQWIYKNRTLSAVIGVGLLCILAIFFTKIFFNRI